MTRSLMMMFRSVGLLLALTLLTPPLARAQDAPAAPANSPSQAAAQTAPDVDPDRDFNRSQPDFVVVNLPTTLRLPMF
jgi:hypothetical protein